MKLDRRTTLALGMAAMARPLAAFSAPDSTLPLWPAGVPDAGPALPVETVVERSRSSGTPDRAVHGIAVPRLVVVRPAPPGGATETVRPAPPGGASETVRPSAPNGACVIICPGGGYRRVVIDREGYDVAAWFAARGITAFVLFYRLPAEGWRTGPDTPLIDAQRAVRTVRAQAARFALDPARVMLLGFSAGGHLAADLGARFASVTRAPVDSIDRLSARPDLVAALYPVIAMEGPLAHAGSREKLIGADAPPDLAHAHTPADNVPPDAPPHFLVHAEDDRSVPPGNSLLLRDALKARGVAVETHLFERGGHGFGLAPGQPAAAWPDLLLAFARTRGLIPPAS